MLTYIVAFRCLKLMAMNGISDVTTAAVMVNLSSYCQSGMCVSRKWSSYVLQVIHTVLINGAFAPRLTNNLAATIMKWNW